MDDFTQNQLVKDSEYLLSLINHLNLEECDKDLDLHSLLEIYTFVGDFKILKNFVYEQKKICCSYGLDSFLFSDLVLRKMQLLVSYLFFYDEKAPKAYCCLKSELFLELKDFVIGIMVRTGEKLKVCNSEAEEAQLLNTIFQIENIYNICL